MAEESSVAVCALRAVLMFPALTQVADVMEPVAGMVKTRAPCCVVEQPWNSKATKPVDDQVGANARPMRAAPSATTAPRSGCTT